MSRFFIKSIHETTKPEKGRVATSIVLFLWEDTQKIYFCAESYVSLPACYAVIGQTCSCWAIILSTHSIQVWKTLVIIIVSQCFCLPCLITKTWKTTENSVVFGTFLSLNDFANVICICIFRETKSVNCVEIKWKK